MPDTPAPNAAPAVPSDLTARLALLPEAVRVMAGETEPCQWEGIDDYPSDQTGLRCVVGTVQCDSPGPYFKPYPCPRCHGTRQQPTVRATLIRALVEAGCWHFQIDRQAESGAMWINWGTPVNAWVCLYKDHAILNRFWTIHYTDPAAVAWLIYGIQHVEGSHHD